MPVDVLKPGDNVVAVEVHSGDVSTKRDLRFDMMLGVVSDGAGLPCASQALLAGNSRNVSVTISRGPYLLAQTPSSVTVRWRTSHVTRGAVVVTPRGADGTTGVPFVVAEAFDHARDVCPGLDHSVVVGGLAPSSRYDYKVTVDTSPIMVHAGRGGRGAGKGSKAGKGTTSGPDDDGTGAPSTTTTTPYRGPTALTAVEGSRATEVHSFHTSPVAVRSNDSADMAAAVTAFPGLRLWALGDSGTGEAGQAKVRDAYVTLAAAEAHPADVLFALGDNAYKEGKEEEYQSHFFDVYEAVMYDTPLWSAFGNHDFMNSKNGRNDGPYFIAFPMPGDGSAGGVASNTPAFYRWVLIFLRLRS